MAVCSPSPCGVSRHCSVHIFLKYVIGFLTIAVRCCMWGIPLRASAPLVGYTFSLTMVGWYMTYLLASTHFIM